MPAVVALLGALGLVGGLGTQAYWNDVATVAGETVTSGSLNLLVDDVEGNPEAYTWASLQMTNMAPGESRAATVTLENAGTTPFTVSATGTASGNLDPHVKVWVTYGGVADNTGSYPRTGSCTGTPTFSDETLGNTGKTVIGATTTLEPGATLAVCVRLLLETTAPNSMQGKSYVPVFVFTATQVAP